MKCPLFPIGMQQNEIEYFPNISKKKFYDLLGPIYNHNAYFLGIGYMLKMNSDPVHWVMFAHDIAICTSKSVINDI